MRSIDKLSDLEFLDLLRKKDVQVIAKDQRLQINAPSGALEGGLREELLRRKESLLACIERCSASNDSIKRREEKVRIPQTPLQQGLWLIDHYSPGNVAYNIPEAFWVDAQIDIDALQYAINKLLIRHEVLRSSFHEEEGELFQSVSPLVESPIGFTDLSPYAEPERSKLLKKLIREQAQQSFDLKKAPLVRFHLFVLGSSTSVFLLNIHHIIADRKAVDVIYEELLVLYESELKNEPAQLPSLEVRYGDYAIWAAEQMESQLVEKQLKYWQRKLVGLPPFLNLPHSLPYPSSRTSWGNTLPIQISPAMQSDLKRIAQEERASTFMTFMAVFAILLHLYSGAEDFCIGSPSTLRKQASTERMVGVFVNSLPFRCQITQEYTLRELIRHIRNTALEAYENNDIPFQKLVSVLKPDRKSQRSPLFQVLMGFESYKGATNLARQLNTEPGTARYDLSLNFVEAQQGVSGSLEYCTDIFTPNDMKIFAQGLSLAERAAKQPDVPFSNL
jgi:hypothetical protein